MNQPTDKKNLTQLEVIELLTLLKDHTEQNIADHFGMTQPAVSYYRKKYGAVNPKVIDRVIIQLNKESVEYGLNVHYEKQDVCISKKFYFKCHDCGFVASENNISGILEHINRCKIKKVSLLTQQKI